MVRHKSVPTRSISSPSNGEKVLLSPSLSFWAFHSGSSSATASRGDKSHHHHHTKKADHAGGHYSGKPKRGLGAQSENGLQAMDVDSSGYEYPPQYDADLRQASEYGAESQMQIGNYHNNNNNHHNVHSNNIMFAGTSKRDRAKLKRRLTMEELEFEKEQALKSHPLAANQDVPAFSDLQLCITQAIVSIGRGKSVSMDDITDFVSKRWRNLRRRDGSHYTTGCVRAIQANLRTNPNGLSLFKRDPENEGNWLLCETMEEALAHSVKKEGPTRTLGTPSSDVEEDGHSPARSPRRRSHSPSSPSSPPTSPTEDANERDLSEDAFAKKPMSRLSTLQKTISQAIRDAGGSCHFEFIVDTVAKKWQDIKIADGLSRSANVKRTVLATLSRDRDEASKAFFTRDHSAESSGYWKLGSINPYQNSDEQRREVPSLSELAKKKVQNQQSSGGNDKLKNTKEAKNKQDTSITALQGLVVNAIAENRWSANFDDIHEHVSQRWGNLKRRDGSPYTADCRRLIQSSLNSNNPAGALYVKDPNIEGNWVLAPRAFQYLREIGKIPPVGDGTDKCFSNVQRLVIESILNHDGSADFDTIVEDATQNWHLLRRKDDTPYVADPRRAILASLSKAAPCGMVFAKDKEMEGNWTLTPDALALWHEALAYTRDGGTAPGRHVKQQLRKEESEEEKEEVEEEGEGGSDGHEDEEDGEEDGSEESDEEQSGRPFKLSAMQEMAVRLICKKGGSCHVDDLLEELAKEMPTNKRLVTNIRQSRIKLDSEQFTTGDGEAIFKRKDPGNNDIWTVANPKLAEYVISKPPQRGQKRARSTNKTTKREKRESKRQR